MHYRRSSLMALLLALVSGLPLVAAPQTANTPEPKPEVFELRPVDPQGLPFSTTFDYRIGRQDLLEIRVFDLEQLDNTVRVSDSGTITLPLLGQIKVAGLTKAELEDRIADLLSERYVQDPQVTIFVKEYESQKVAVSGAVKRPDTYEMLGRKTLLEMISMAGGLDGDLSSEIVIFRRDDTGTARRIGVDLRRLVYEADPTLNVAILPGDIIYVPAVETMRIFVSGAVRNPDLYEVPSSDPVTVLKAITLAGGTTDRAAEKRVQIIRTGADGGRQTLLVDLRRIKKGRADDLVLLKDDLVLVPESFF